MPSIEVDNDVFGRLQKRARPFLDTPNDVIRDVLDEVEAVPTTSIATTAVGPEVPLIGRLHKLVEDGSVRPGDKVRHHRKRTREVFEATITAGGCLTVDGVPVPFREPSPALRHFTGTQIDGWHNWVHVDSNRTLRDLRDNGERK